MVAGCSFLVLSNIPYYSHREGLSQRIFGTNSPEYGHRRAKVSSDTLLMGATSKSPSLGILSWAMAEVCSTHRRSTREGSEAMSHLVSCRQVVFIGIAVLVTSTSFASGPEDEWKLRPLSYNNPGLEVDLGVGLWAWPLPMDFDRDGDLDLVVSCPDKPSQRTLVF